MVADDFAPVEDEALIQEISKCPEIYDPQHEGYKKIPVKDKQWECIGKKLNKSIDQCKRRWKNHRDNYFKQKKLKVKSGRVRRKNAIVEKLSFLENIEAKSPRSRLSIISGNRDPLSDTQADSLVLEIDSSTNQVQTYTIDSDDGSSYEPEIEQVASLHENSSFSREQFHAVNESIDPLNHCPDVLLELLKKRDQENGLLLEALANLQNQSKDCDELDLFFKCVSKTIKKFPPHAVCEIKTKIFRLVSEQEMKLLQETNKPGSSTPEISNS